MREDGDMCTKRLIFRIRDGYLRHPGFSKAEHIECRSYRGRYTDEFTNISFQFLNSLSLLFPYHTWLFFWSKEFSESRQCGKRCVAAIVPQCLTRRWKYNNISRTTLSFQNLVRTKRVEINKRQQRLNVQLSLSNYNHICLKSYLDILHQLAISLCEDNSISRAWYDIEELCPFIDLKQR